MNASSMKLLRYIGPVLSVMVFGTCAWAQATGTALTALPEAVQRAPTSVNTNPTVAPKPARISRRRRRHAEKMFLAGSKAIEKGDGRSAERDFELAHEFDPQNHGFPRLAEIARQYVIAQLVQSARNQWSSGRKEDAAALLEEALRFDPESPAVTECIATLTAKVSARPPEIRGESRQASVSLALSSQKDLHSFHVNADKRSLIVQVFSAYGIRATVDQSVNAQAIRFDTDDVDFAGAATLLELATGTFFVPLDPDSALVVADNEGNRAKFVHLAMRTFYFPGLSSKELTDMWNIARNVFGAQQSLIEPLKGTLTVRAPDYALEALDETYAELLTGRSGLQLDARLFEIDKTKAKNVGIVLPGSTTVFNVPSEISSILKNNASLVDELLKEDPSLAGNYASILAALIASGALTGTVFNSPLAIFGGGLTKTGLDLSGVSVNMLLNSSDARSVRRIELRVLDQEEATIRSGERYPIMTSSFSSVAGSSSSNGVIPQFQYEDLGLTLKVTPHVESSNAVSLNLDMKLSSLAGASLNNIPILANRQYSGVVSLGLGDSAILVSDLSKQESFDITGVPGLSDIPGFSDATNRQDTKDIMELAIVITPHLVRLSHQEIAGPMLVLPR